MTVPCKDESCDRDFTSVHAMHTHFGIEHGDPHETGRPVDSSMRDDLIDAHPQMETVPEGVVDMEYDDGVSADHIRLYRWYESHERRVIKEYRIAKFKDSSTIQGSEWMEISPEYVDSIQDMLMEVEFDNA